VLSWLGFVVTGFVFVASLFNITAGGWLGLILVSIAFGATYWQYHVLTRESVRRLFGGGHKVNSPASSDRAV
jgi:hypothetical protein